MPSIQEQYSDLATCLDRLADYAAADDERLFARHTGTSSWSVAEHVVHTAKATATMLAAIERIAQQTEPAHEGGSISIAGRAILLSGRFPRGRAEAPSRTRPPAALSRADVDKFLSHNREVFARTEALLPDAVASGWKSDHPYLGPLDAAQWLRMAEVHALHHFRIAEDILTAARNA